MDLVGKLGVVQMDHQMVVAQIAQVEALSVEGVAGLSEHERFMGLSRVLTGEDTPRGIRVNLLAGDQISVDIHIMMKYGSDIPSVAEKVQVSVLSRVREMAPHLNMTAVNVTVDGVAPPESARVAIRQSMERGW